MSRDRAELGAFLRARRGQLTPAQAGITPFPGPRRVPGLRREELAVAAGLSPDYYSRLEQGRQANISREVLNALARALRLDDVARAHLHDLAAPVTMSRAPVHGVPQRADPGLLRLLDALGHLPALVLGWRGEVLARTGLLPAVLGHPMDAGTSFIRYMLQDRGARERIVNWVTFAEFMVAALRRESSRHPHDRSLHRLIDEIRATEPLVAGWWDDHGVRDYSSVAKHIRHPVAGDLHFDIEVVGAPHEPLQRLIVYTCQPDSQTARMLPLLASWNETTVDAR
ncbi:helix-turn-helix domain-containing protein [Catenuloplanes atrovinosus]|uniref:Transcriptional regulator with XRE-family HTH domain n=1 Tax=Catenuloplanes atrovinosus TaxID=137266 RepID=A0AAE3YPK6_9ACTN|nr:helix-turn-helix transcriptional regulator [Catenuloplanes atrovinosus]MDR7275979.1 transcriptional regulator with XRE-family HTH domain [Catenuloplanes atrovinosus]